MSNLGYPTKHSEMIACHKKEIPHDLSQARNLERFAVSIPKEKWFEYFFCVGCETCPAKQYCDEQPDETCCRENFLAWAEMEAT